MKTSCVHHPANEPLIIIKKWQVEACDGNHCAAALLSYLEYWHNIRIDQSTRSRRQNEVAENHGDLGTQDTSLFQFHTEADLVSGLLGLFKQDSIRKALVLLAEKKYVSVHRNPNNRYAFDKTKHFLFDPDAVNAFIDQRIIGDPSQENQGRSPKNQGRSPKNQGAIQEITSEITSEKNNKNCTNNNFENDSEENLKPKNENNPTAKLQDRFESKGNPYRWLEKKYPELEGLWVGEESHPDLRSNRFSAFHKNTLIKVSEHLTRCKMAGTTIEAANWISARISAISSNREEDTKALGQLISFYQLAQREEDTKAVEREEIDSYVPLPLPIEVNGEWVTQE